MYVHIYLQSSIVNIEFIMEIQPREYELMVSYEARTYILAVTYTDVVTKRYSRICRKSRNYTWKGLFANIVSLKVVSLKIVLVKSL